jgi:Putative beta-barrel porin 2
MKKNFAFALSSLATVGFAAADLYYIPGETQESKPLHYSVGLDATWDSNATPTSGSKESAFGLTPYVGLSFTSLTPQTTLDVYARVSGLYYVDQPEGVTDDFYQQFRSGVDWTYRISDRLRFSSRNFLAYEMEPDYSYGYASSRQLDEHLFWQTDNSVGYQWTQRFATYTGVTFSGLNYGSDVKNQDRLTWLAYNQFRYQFTQQTLGTMDYRYGKTQGDGEAADSSDQYFLVGAEHRFSMNTIGTVSAGVQFHSVDASNGDDNSAPYLEAALRSQINEQFSLRGFAHYGIESYDTVRTVKGINYDFGDRRTLRIGLSSEYALNPRFTLFGGLDYIPATFSGGRPVDTTIAQSAGDQSEDLINAYIGVSVKLTDNLYGTASFNYTDSSSDFDSMSYDRERVNVGVRAEF